MIRHVILLATLWLATAVSNGQLQVDTFIDFEAGTNGEVVTSGLLNSSSHGSGTWQTEVSLGNAPLTYATITNMSAPGLPGPVKVGGTIYAGGGSRCLAMVHNNFEAAVLQFASDHSKVCVGYWWNPSFGGSTDFGFYDEVSIMAGSDFCVNSFECDGNTSQVVKCHTQAGTSATAIDLTPLGSNNAKWYWVCQLYESGALGRIAIYNSHLQQIGSTATLPIAAGNPASEIFFGQHHDVDEPASTAFYNDVIVAFDTNAVFPLLPGGGTNVEAFVLSQPQNTTVGVGQTATFSVVASGQAPLSYQWKWYSTNVPGATAASWTTPPLVAENSGSPVQVGVSNALGGALSATVVLSVSTNSAPPGKAAFNGLVFDANNLAPQSSGSISVNTTASGAFSGKVQLGNVRSSFKGAFDQNGEAAVVITRRSGNALNLQLLSYPEASQITGLIGDGTWSASVTAVRAGYDGRTSLAPQAGKYTMLVSGNPLSNSVPAGDGYATVTVDKAGRVRVSATLADRAKLNQTSSLGTNGICPLYGSLYAGQGTGFGWLNSAPASDTELHGQLNWLKPADGRAKMYPAGFTNQAVMVGGAYHAPVKGGAVFNFTEGQIVFVEGEQAVTNLVVLHGNIVKNLSSNKLSLSLAPAAGTFSGRVSIPGTSQSLPFNGVLLPKQQMASGSYIGADRSGLIRLTTRE